MPGNQPAPSAAAQEAATATQPSVTATATTDYKSQSATASSDTKSTALTPYQTLCKAVQEAYPNADPNKTMVSIILSWVEPTRFRQWYEGKPTAIGEAKDDIAKLELRSWYGEEISSAISTRYPGLASWPKDNKKVLLLDIAIFQEQVLPNEIQADRTSNQLGEALEEVLGITEPLTTDGRVYKVGPPSISKRTDLIEFTLMRMFKITESFAKATHRRMIENGELFFDFYLWGISDKATKNLVANIKVALFENHFPPVVAIIINEYNFVTDLVPYITYDDNNNVVTREAIRIPGFFLQSPDFLCKFKQVFEALAYGGGADHEYVEAQLRNSEFLIGSETIHNRFPRIKLHGNDIQVTQQHTDNNQTQTSVGAAATSGWVRSEAAIFESSGWVSLDSTFLGGLPAFSTEIIEVRVPVYGAAVIAISHQQTPETAAAPPSPKNTLS